MNFSAALEALRAGKKVRLPEMKDYFIYISTVYNLTFNTSRKVSHIRLTNYKDEQDWTPSEEELLSEKWELVDEYAKAELLQYFKCPRCNENAGFDKKFLLVDPKGRDIIECEHCKNKVEIVKKDRGTKACCGEKITQTGANNFKTVISGESRILFYKGNDLETWYEVEMIPDDIQKHIQKIKDFESAHVKTENIEYEEETGELTFQLVPIPRGMKIRIDDLNRTPSEIDANINGSISKASYRLKEAAIKDVMEWIKESKIKANVQGIDLFFESGVPENMLPMNFTTFLKFKEMIKK